MLTRMSREAFLHFLFSGRIYTDLVLFPVKISDLICQCSHLVLQWSFLFCFCLYVLCCFFEGKIYNNNFDFLTRHIALFSGTLPHKF